MTFQWQIESLRRRFWSGDNSARDDLHRLLHPRLILIVRRAWRCPNAESPVARGIRRLGGKTRQAGERGSSQVLLAADELCRRLCEELLQTPAGSAEIERAADTIRSVGRTVRVTG